MLIKILTLSGVFSIYFLVTCAATLHAEPTKQDLPDRLLPIETRYSIPATYRLLDGSERQGEFVLTQLNYKPGLLVGGVSVIMSFDPAAAKAGLPYILGLYSALSAIHNVGSKYVFGKMFRFVPDGDELGADLEAKAVYFSKEQALKLEAIMQNVRLHSDTNLAPYHYKAVVASETPDGSTLNSVELGSNSEGDRLDVNIEELRAPSACRVLLMRLIGR